MVLYNKSPSVKAMVFPVVMYGLWKFDYKESWVPKYWCFWTMVLEKSLESPLDCRAIQLVNPKGNQSQIFVGRTDAEAETLILWPLDVKNWLIRRDTDTGKDWRREEKGMAEDEIDSITDSMNMNLSQLWKTVENRGAWWAAVHGVIKIWIILRSWTTINCTFIIIFIIIIIIKVYLRDNASFVPGHSNRTNITTK